MFLSAQKIADILKQEGLDINIRKIKYYANDIKILPPLVSNGNKMSFTDLHLLYVRAILILQKNGTSLKDIKNKLDDMSKEEIQLLCDIYKPIESEDVISLTKSIYESQNGNGYNASTYDSMGSLSGLSLPTQSNGFRSTDVTFDSLSNELSTVSTNSISSGQVSSNAVSNNKDYKTLIINDDISLQFKNLTNEQLKEIKKSIIQITKEIK